MDEAPLLTSIGFGGTKATGPAGIPGLQGGRLLGDRMNRVASTWGKQALPEDDHLHLQIGPLAIWLERASDELHGAFSRKPPVGEEVPSSKPDGIEWSRWICGTGALELRLRPVLPPRPLVVRPRMPLQVLPGQRLQFFVSVPVYVWGDLLMGSPAAPVAAFDEPTVVLSNSWYGNPVDGELCYALRTRARRTLEELRSDRHLAICPLRVSNESAKPWLFERICLQGPRMHIFAGEHHLWTSMAHLTQKGDEASPVSVYDSVPPPFDQAQVRLSEPREQLKRSVMERAFGGLRGWGML